VAPPFWMAGGTVTFLLRYGSKHHRASPHALLWRHLCSGGRSFRAAAFRAVWFCLPLLPCSSIYDSRAEQRGMALPYVSVCRCRIFAARQANAAFVVLAYLRASLRVARAAFKRGTRYRLWRHSSRPACLLLSYLCCCGSRSRALAGDCLAHHAASGVSLPSRGAFAGATVLPFAMTETLVGEETHAWGAGRVPRTDAWKTTVALHMPGIYVACTYADTAEENAAG